MSRNSGSFFFLLTHAIIGALSGSFLALLEEVVFSTVLFEKENVLVCCKIGLLASTQNYGI